MCDMTMSKGLPQVVIQLFFKTPPPFFFIFFCAGRGALDTGDV
jgi:hypothetical protein